MFLKSEAFLEQYHPSMFERRDVLVVSCDVVTVVSCSLVWLARVVVLRIGSHSHEDLHQVRHRVHRTRPITVILNCASRLRCWTVVRYTVAWRGFSSLHNLSCHHLHPTTIHHTIPTTLHSSLGLFFRFHYFDIDLKERSPCSHDRRFDGSSPCEPYCRCHPTALPKQR